jgi:hypothetical protein
VIKAAEIATDGHKELVHKAISEMFGQLDERRVLSFTENAIPEWALLPMRDVIAYRIASALAIDPQRMPQLRLDHDAGLADIYKHLGANTYASTDEELEARVLARLGAIGQGEVTPSAYSARVSDAIAEVFAWYAVKGELGFDSATIPDRAMIPLRDVVSYRIAREFAVLDPSTLAILKLEHDAAIAELDSRMDALDVPDTKDRLRNRVLQHLGVLGLAEIATPAQKEAIGDIVEATIEQLRAHRVISFDSHGIPDWAMLPLRDYVAYRAASSLRIDLNRIPQLKMDHDMAWAELKKQAATSAPPPAVEATYY